MRILELLKTFFLGLFGAARPGPGGQSTARKAGPDAPDSGGLETRCINPDTGCRFAGP